MTDPARTLTFVPPPPRPGEPDAGVRVRRLPKHAKRALRCVSLKEAAAGPKAGADTWGIASVLRQDPFRRVRGRWCHAVGLDRFRSPYSGDEVVRFYFRYRKRKPEELAAFEAVLGVEG